MGYDYTKGHLSESRIVADDTDFADFWHRLLVCAGLTKTKPATIRRNTQKHPSKTRRRLEPEEHQ